MGYLFVFFHYLININLSQNYEMSSQLVTTNFRVNYHKVRDNFIESLKEKYLQ